MGALCQVETGSRGLPAAATDPGEHGDDLGKTQTTSENRNQLGRSDQQLPDGQTRDHASHK